MARDVILLTWRRCVVTDAAFLLVIGGVVHVALDLMDITTPDVSWIDKTNLKGILNCTFLNVSKA